ncbi:RHS repeat domain-containing protein [Meiothermus taiwanensis]|uniref:RHS repeat domain-containing protein n=1 Tax=Meiothermus taiwanensis TaxID=172827 RepID=UPI001CC121CB|nr:RHS repeat domain-containing protein [Meiothermus taiwanensis]
MLWLSALELAEGLAHLEEGELLDPNEPAWSHEALEVAEAPAAPFEPAQHRPHLEGAYCAAQVELYSPPGLLLLRRVVEEGGDLLEITTPNGSVYTFEYDRVRAYLRPLLPH